MCISVIIATIILILAYVFGFSNSPTSNKSMYIDPTDRPPSLPVTKPSTIDRAPSTIDRAPSTIDRAPSTIDRAPSTTDYINERANVSRATDARSKKHNIDEPQHDYINKRKKKVHFAPRAEVRRFNIDTNKITGNYERAT